MEQRTADRRTRWDQAGSDPDKSICPGDNRLSYPPRRRTYMIETYFLGARSSEMLCKLARDLNMR